MTSLSYYELTSKLGPAVCQYLVRLGFVPIHLEVATGSWDTDSETIQILGCDDLASQPGPGVCNEGSGRSIVADSHKNQQPFSPPGS